MLSFLAGLNYLRLGIAGVILALTLFSWSQYKEAKKYKLKMHDAFAEMQVKTGQAEQYRNDLDQKVLVINGYEKHFKELQFSKDSLEVALYKAIEASRLKPKEVREAIVVYVDAEGSGAIQLDTVFIDSSRIDTIYKTFEDGFLTASFSDDSLFYSYDEEIILLKAKREVERNFFLWRWIGWKKKINRDLIEISSNNPNSKLDGRLIKLE